MSDRARCQNGLRQLGLANHNYHDAFGHFPAGMTGESAAASQPFLSWCARLLPYLGEEALWRQVIAAFEQDRDFLNDPPHTLLGTTVRHFICPSDPRIQSSYRVGNSSSLRAFTSYLGVNGTNAALEDGVLYRDSHIAMTDITDGSSNTIAIGERPPGSDFVFGWWYAGWGQDKDGEADMILGARTKNVSDFGKSCTDGGPFGFRAGTYSNPCDAFHFWSPHTGGANFAFADGSVRFLSYSVDSIIPALATRAGGETVELP
jgi:prepilin-type processing-associated H-X9-DG protein